MGIAVTTHGREAIKAKGIARRATIETMHSYYCSEPLVAGEFFSVVLRQDVTFKGKPRTTIEEIGVFQVQNGKIVKEQFFY
jgi:limonene-1,2-epoxide hydrolase